MSGIVIGSVLAVVVVIAIIVIMIRGKGSSASIDPEYLEIFIDMDDDNKCSQATKKFEGLLQTNKQDVLKALLAWDGNYLGMDRNNFIFALYDEWESQITSQIFWKIHIGNKGLVMEEDSLPFSTLGRVINEAKKNGQQQYIDEIEQATPEDAEKNFQQLL